MSDADTLDHIIRLRLMLEKVLRPYNEATINQTLKKIGFTPKEKTAWVRNEPDFTPRRKPPDKLPVYLGG